jgi:hypothetical protein
MFNFFSPRLISLTLPLPQSLLSNSFYPRSIPFLRISLLSLFEIDSRFSTSLQNHSPKWLHHFSSSPKAACLLAPTFSIKKFIWFSKIYTAKNIYHKISFTFCSQRFRCLTQIYCEAQ